jgi:hypothetical protein
MLFVIKDLREEREESTRDNIYFGEAHDNILRDDDTLISFLCRNHEIVDANKNEDLLLQLFSLNFLYNKFTHLNIFL